MEDHRATSKQSAHLVSKTRSAEYDHNLQACFGPNPRNSPVCANQWELSMIQLVHPGDFSSKSWWTPTVISTCTAKVHQQIPKNLRSITTTAETVHFQLWVPKSSLCTSHVSRTNGRHLQKPSPPESRTLPPSSPGWWLKQRWTDLERGCCCCWAEYLKCQMQCGANLLPLVKDMRQ